MKTSITLCFTKKHWSRFCTYMPGAVGRAAALVVLSALLYLGNTPLHAQKIAGELRKWHKVTLTFDGPSSDETATPNPFLDYRMDVTFTHGSKQYVVPGYFAADGDAAETSAASGNQWRVHFAPDEAGTWTYKVSFRKGTQVAVSDSPLAGTSADYFDGTIGAFDISETDKTGRDFRGKGRLRYVGKHHLQFAETGEYFVKGGADAPENFLAYQDFDGPFKTDGEKDDLVKSWAAHAPDWKSGDPVWQGTKGKGMIGALNYLAAKGMNAFSFLTLTIEGDDRNVFPYTDYYERKRFDCSRLDQWEVIFEHADKLGLYLHIKTQETENDQLLDGGKLGVQRKLYYRMLIARFGHHLALNWNLGEENDVWQELNDPTNNYVKSYANYFAENDPYHHHIVIHTYPGQQDKVYPSLVGNQSRLTGVSIQTGWSDVFNQTKKWVDQSAASGKPWVVANDEQGDHKTGVKPDGSGNNHGDIRKQTLWGNLMAGGAGVEYYFGYQFPQSDLTCEDWRSRDNMWTYTHHALRFFEEHIPFWNMKNDNSLVSGVTSYCLTQPGEVYAVYLLNGGNATLDVSGYNNTFNVRWYNPRTGKFAADTYAVMGGSKTSLGLPPSETDQDWLALVEVSSGGNTVPTVTIQDPKANTTFSAGSSFTIQADAQDSDGTIEVVRFYDGKKLLAEDRTAPFTCEVAHALVGECLLTAQATDSQGATTTSAPVRIFIQQENAENCPASFVEHNGLVVIEAESGNNDGGWSKKSSAAGYTGNGYLEWTGSNQFNNAGLGTISYQIYIGKTGTYRFQWRNRIVQGSDNTEHNDTWLRFVDASDFYGQKGSSKVYPKGSGKSPNPNGASVDGWFKIYTNSSGWNWQTTTSDHDRHDIYVSFDSPGVYTLQVSGRSYGHAIDRMVLSHSSVSHSAAQNTSLSETTCHRSTANATLTVNAGSDQTLTLPKNSTTLTASASDPDGSVASYQWVKVSGPNANLSGINTSQLTASGLVAGSYVFKVTVEDNNGASASDQVNVNVKEAVVIEPDPDVEVHAIPGQVEAEAYASAQGIQTEATRDAGGGKNIGYINNGDYADYRVNVAQAGRYAVAFRVASATSGGSITLEQDNTTLGSMAVSSTGGWQSWQTVQTEVSLAAGEQTLRLQFSGSSTFLFNVNYLSFTEADDTVNEEPAFHAIPGQIEAEAYASMQGIQTEATNDAGGGQNVGYINNGDYVDYRVKVAQAGSYQLALRVASATSGGNISVKRGSSVLGSVAVANTGGWQSWQTVQTEVSLAAGEQTLRLQFSGNSTFLFNVNYLSFTEGADSPSDEVPPSGTPPSGMPPSSQILTLSPIHDAYLQNGARYNTQELRTEKGQRISYLMFDLSQVQQPVAEAKLVLSVGDDAGWGSIQVQQGSHNQWTEESLSEANKPLAQGVLGSRNGQFISGNNYTFDLANLPVGGKVTLLLVHNSNEASAADVAFASSEADNAAIRPSLIVITGVSARTAVQTSQPKGNGNAIGQGDEVVRIYPNPASEYVVVAGDATSYAVISQEGHIVQSGLVGTDGQIAVNELKVGLYHLRLLRAGTVSFHKVLIRR